MVQIPTTAASTSATPCFDGTARVPERVLRAPIERRFPGSSSPPFLAAVRAVEADCRVGRVARTSGFFETFLNRHLPRRARDMNHIPTEMIPATKVSTGR